MKKLHFFLKKESSSGFTIIELLVAVFIISVLSIITVSSLRIGNDQQALLRSAQLLAFNLRNAQNLSLSPKKYGVDPVCFYGINIDSSVSYFLYYDDRTGCPGLGTGGNKYSNGLSTVLGGSIQLEAGVEFSNYVNQDIAFVPPEPLTYFFGDNSFSSGSKEIVVRLVKDNSKQKKIIINKFGNIEIQ